MAQPEFSVHLGGGLYMDSNGTLSHGPVLGKPIYPMPGGGLPIQPDALGYSPSRSPIDSIKRRPWITARISILSSPTSYITR